MIAKIIIVYLYNKYNEVYNNDNGIKNINI